MQQREATFICYQFTNRGAFTAVYLHAAPPLSLMTENETFRLQITEELLEMQSTVLMTTSQTFAEIAVKCRDVDFTDVQ